MLISGSDEEGLAFRPYNFFRKDIPDRRLDVHVSAKCGVGLVLKTSGRISAELEGAITSTGSTFSGRS